MDSSIEGIIKLLRGIIVDIDSDPESSGGYVINDEAYTAEDLENMIDTLNERK